MVGTKGSRACALLSLLLLVVVGGGSVPFRMPALSIGLPTSVEAQSGGDNCPNNANFHQEDSDGNGVGDMCDPYTINPIFEADNLPAPGSFHAATPFYRALVRPESVLFSPEAGFGTPRPPSIGFAGADDSRVSMLAFAGATGLSDSFPSTVGPGPLQQSTWQSLVATIAPTTPEIGGHPIRQHHGTGANAIGLGYEIELSRVATAPVKIDHVLTLPIGWTLDASELTAGGMIGRLTLRDEGGVPRVRISAVDVAAFGKPTVLQDSASFFGLTRLSQELQASPIVVGTDLVGNNFYDGVEAPLVQAKYFLDENMSDTGFGRTEIEPLIVDGPPAFRVTMVAPAAVIDRNRATSDRIIIGMRISSLTPVNLGTGTTIHGRHVVGFDEEATVTGANVTIKLQNTLGTFNGSPTDYSLLPNGGGTAARQRAAEQQQTKWSCNGCTMDLTGNSTIQFVGGGAGVGVSAGSPVGPAHPCLGTSPLDRATNTGRCEAGKVLRGSFVADKLTIRGSMSGLAATESDVALQVLTFFQKRDPNVTDPLLLHGVIGAGCSADAGVRIGRNPSDGQVTANVPVDPSGTPLATPPTTGICNFTARRVELVGMAAVDNPEGTDLTVPSGDGLAFHMRAGRGDIGPRRFNTGTAMCELQGGDGKPSLIEGFEVAGSFSGGANVEAATGEPLAAGGFGAVPPNVYCLDKIRANDNESGLVVNGNVHVIASRLQIERTQFGGIQLGGSTANVATPASGCPTLDGACRTPVVELVCPSCSPGGANFRAVASLGLTAPTKLTLIQSVIGLDAQGVASGQNPALPALVLNADHTPQSGGLTIGRRAASLFTTPVLVTKGADSKLSPQLVSLVVQASNIGVNGAAMTIENRDARGTSDISLLDNCYTPDGAICITRRAPVLATSEADSAVTALNTTALNQAVNTLNLAGIALDCTAIVPDPNPANPRDIDTALKALCDATLAVPVGGASAGFARAGDQAFLLGKTADAAMKIDEGTIFGACGKMDSYDDKLASLSSSGANARINAAAKASLEAASDVVIARLYAIAADAGLEAQCRAVLRDRS